MSYSLLEALRELNEEQFEEGKNYDELSNAVESPKILYYILKNKSIKASSIKEDDLYKLTKLEEPDTEGNKYKYNELPGYICMSRDITLHPKINNDQWGWAVIIDGDKLSDKYRIRPVNQRFGELNKQDNTRKIKGNTIKKFNLKSITKWINVNDESDVLYSLLIANYPETFISKEAYDELVILIDKINDDTQKNLKQYFIVKTGTTTKIESKDNKRYKKITYWYDIPNPNIPLSPNSVSNRTLINIFKQSNNLFDTEEKVTFKKVDPSDLKDYNTGRKKYSNNKGIVKGTDLLTGEDTFINGIDISNCIKGIVVPEYAAKMLRDKNFSYLNIPFSKTSFDQRQSIKYNATYLNTVHKNKLIAKYLENISKLMEPEWKIVSYNSKTDSFKNYIAAETEDETSLSLDNIKSKTGSFPQKAHFVVNDPKKFNNLRVIIPKNNAKVENSVVFDYSPFNAPKPIVTRLSSRAIIWGKDKNNNLYVLVQYDKNNIELPGGGISSLSENPLDTLKREIKEECNITDSELGEFNKLPSYWYLMNSKWVENNIEKAEDQWKGYFNFFYEVEYLPLINKNKLAVEGEELNVWYPVNSLLEDEKFYKGHISTWVKEIKNIIKNKGY